MPVFHGATIGSGVVIVTPSGFGTAGQSLKSDGAGNSNWEDTTDVDANYNWTGEHYWTKPMALVAAYFSGEPIHMPTGTTAAINLASANHQTITLASATGDLTLTMLVPLGSGAGTLIIKQGATARDITWATDASAVIWLGTEPTWNADANKTRVISWRYDATNLYLSATATD